MPTNFKSGNTGLTLVLAVATGLCAFNTGSPGDFEFTGMLIASIVAGLATLFSLVWFGFLGKNP